MKMLDLLLKKRSGLELTKAEIEFIALGAADGSIPDYQLSSWLMAAFLNGLTPNETAWLTSAMALSGKKLDLSGIKGAKVDKHSTGGVGDGISVALAPVAAACGVVVPMMSGRGLGHTGGTLDKLEAIKGFKVRLEPGYVVKQLKATGLSMFGQTEQLAPSDKKLYALRDASCTVEALPLIVASILSKKYAEDITGLVMDVKYGSGAFLKDFKKSRELAVALMKTSKLLGIRCVAVMTAMNEPLGLAIGNGIEISQSVKILAGEKGPADFMEVLEVLAGWMVHLGGKARSAEEGARKARAVIADGSALEKFRLMVKWQGGDVRVASDPDRFMPKAKRSAEIKAKRAGFLTAMEARTVGFASVALGAGRAKAEDAVDFGAGFILEKKPGDRVRPGDVIAKAYASSPSKLADGVKMFESSLAYGNKAPRKEPLIREIIK
ncbi:MAG TPA: thymidine phosphorylase [Elusimicrobia bacterium]|nr:MAG: thymidine phosphorylase [Elusimicrobia bacterium GWF2_62_30]HBA60756.1 thymidine phosphorylase [Elusimicrobiota bacterium]